MPLNQCRFPLSAQTEDLLTTEQLPMATGAETDAPTSGQYHTGTGERGGHGKFMGHAKVMLLNDNFVETGNFL